MTTFALPDLGEGLQEAEIVTWHVGVGDHVVADQPLVSVETEKAVVEVPAPQSGHIARLLADEGDVVAVGAPLVEFAEGPHAESGTVVGKLEKPAATPPEAAAPAPPQRAPSSPATPSSSGTRVRAAPAVRARARELGIDLDGISGTGPDGAVTLEDLNAAEKPAGGALRGARRSMATNMTRAWAQVAHATLHDDADIDTWPADADVTTRLIRALVAASAAEPALNARFHPAGPSLERCANVNIGIAIDSPDGLFVPVLHDAGALAATEIRTRIANFKTGVAARSLPPETFRNPTITLSNFGTLTGRYAELIVMPPQVAILGAGRAMDRAMKTNDGIALHRMLPLSLTFDHRAVTGGEAARFLGAVIIDLEKTT